MFATLKLHLRYSFCFFQYYFSRPPGVASVQLFLRSIFFLIGRLVGWLVCVGWGSKFLDSGFQPSLSGSPGNLNTSLLWGQAWNLPAKFFYPAPKNLAGENLKFRRTSAYTRRYSEIAWLRNGSIYRQTKTRCFIYYTADALKRYQTCGYHSTLFWCLGKKIINYKWRTKNAYFVQ